MADLELFFGIYHSIYPQYPFIDGDFYIQRGNIEEEYTSPDIIDRIYKYAEKHIPEKEKDIWLSNILFTLTYAFYCHDKVPKKRYRKSGEHYINHPIEVTQILFQKGITDIDTLTAALLHDVVEDTHIDLDTIGKLFGENVQNTVDGLTKVRGLHRDKNEKETLKKIYISLGSEVNNENLRVVLIKIADRLHNMRTIEALSKDKQIEIARETIEIFVPLARRVGLLKWSEELYRLSAHTIGRITNNEDILNYLDTTASNNLNSPIISSLKALCSNFDVSNDVEIREEPNRLEDRIAFTFNEKNEITVHTSDVPTHYIHISCKYENLELLYNYLCHNFNIDTSDVVKLSDDTYRICITTGGVKNYLYLHSKKSFEEYFTSIADLYTSKYGRKVKETIDKKLLPIRQFIAKLIEGKVSPSDIEEDIENLLVRVMLNNREYFVPVSATVLDAILRKEENIGQIQARIEDEECQLDTPITPDMKINYINNTKENVIDPNYILYAHTLHGKKIIIQSIASALESLSGTSKEKYKDRIRAASIDLIAQYYENKYRMSFPLNISKALKFLKYPHTLLIDLCTQEPNYHIVSSQIYDICSSLHKFVKSLPTITIYIKEDSIGVLAEITTIIANNGFDIASTTTKGTIPSRYRLNNYQVAIIITLWPDDNLNIDTVINNLSEKYSVEIKNI